MTERNPKVNPEEGDVVHQKGGYKEVLVDLVREETVYFRVTDGCGALIRSLRMSVDDWRASWEMMEGE